MKRRAPARSQAQPARRERTEGRDITQLVVTLALVVLWALALIGALTVGSWLL